MYEITLIASNQSQIIIGLWCWHEVQTPNYTNVWEEEQKKDGPTCGLMDGAYKLLGLRLSKLKYLIIKVSLCILLLAI